MQIVFPLFVTLAIETGIYILFRQRSLKLFIFVSILNVILNVSMNIGLSFVNDNKLYWIILSCSEIATTLIEGFALSLIMKEKIKKMLLLSFIANAASFLVGLIFFFTPIYQTRITIIIVTIVFGLIYLFNYFIVFTMFVRHYREKDHKANRDGDKEEYKASDNDINNPS